jgi:hypothetical protein
MAAWIEQGLVYAEFLEALEGFAGGNTSWNSGAVRLLYGEQAQSCYVLNFLLPSQSMMDTEAHYPYNPASALVYTLCHPKKPFVLVISDSEALRPLISEAVNNSIVEHRAMAKSKHVSIDATIHTRLAQMSAKGWQNMLLSIERQVSILLKMR